MKPVIKCNFAEAFLMVYQTIDCLEQDCVPQMTEEDRGKVFDILNESFDYMKEKLTGIKEIVKRIQDPENN
jgi:hypothetical protein